MNPNFQVALIFLMALQATSVAGSPYEPIPEQAGEDPVQSLSELNQRAVQFSLLGNLTRIIPDVIGDELNESRDDLKRAVANRLVEGFNDTAEGLHGDINNTTEQLKERAKVEFREQVERQAQPGMGMVLGLLGVLAASLLLREGRGKG